MVRSPSRVRVPPRHDNRDLTLIPSLIFPAMPKLTDYELERQANIERNKALLQAIGIYHAEVAPSRETEQLKAVSSSVSLIYVLLIHYLVQTIFAFLTNQKSREKELRREKEREQGKHASSKRRARLSAPSAFTNNEPRRKSARLASYASSTGNNDSLRHDMSSDPIDFLSHPGPSSPPKPRQVTLRRLPPPVPPSPQWEEEVDPELFDESYRAPLPTRGDNRTLHFSDRTQFTPNMTPEEMFRAGSFGGTAFAYVYVILPSTLSPFFPFLKKKKS